jgi:hypothetical protein
MMERAPVAAPPKGRSGVATVLKAGPTPHEVFPDLHHKMSKKIAQLTKVIIILSPLFPGHLLTFLPSFLPSFQVIYHLNSRNEDRQYELEEVHSSHQRELQDILQDAATKISRFKEQLDTKRGEAATAREVEHLRVKHEKERAEALEQLRLLKRQAADREDALGDEYARRVDDMEEEVSTMKQAFAESAAQFSERSAALEISLERARAGEKEATAALRASHAAELAEAVQTGNERYNSMIAEQMAEKEVLKQELSIELQNAAEQQLGRLRAELGAQKETALLSVKREAAAELARVREELLAKVGSAVSHGERASRERDEALEVAESVRKELVAARKEAEITAAALNTTGKSSAEALQQLRVQLRERSQEVNQLQASMAELQARAQEAEAASDFKVQSLQESASSQVTALQARNEELRCELDRALARYRELADSSSKEALVLRTELQEKETALAMARGVAAEKTRLVTEWEGKAQSAEVLTNETRALLDRLQEKGRQDEIALARMTEGLSGEKARLLQEKDSLYSTLEQTRSDLAAQKASGDASAVEADRLRSLLNVSSNEIKELRSRIEASSREEGGLRLDYETACQKVKELQCSLESAAVEADGLRKQLLEGDRERDGLIAQLKDVRLSVSSIETQREAEQSAAADLRKEVAVLKSSNSELQKAEGLLQKMAAEADEARRETTERLQTEAREALALARRTQQSAVAAADAARARDVEMLRADMIVAHAAEMSALRQKYQQMSATQSAEAEELKRSVQDLEMKLCSTRELLERTQKMGDIAVEQERSRTLEEARAGEAALKSIHEKDLEAALQRERLKHAEAIEALQLGWEKKADECTQKARDAEKAAAAEAAAALARGHELEIAAQAAAAAELLDAERKRLCDAMIDAENSADQRMMQATEDLASVRASSQQEIEALKKQIESDREAAKCQIAAADRRVDAERAEAEQNAAAAAQNLAMQKAAADGALAAERENRERNASAAAATLAAEREAFENQRREYEQTIVDARGSIVLLERQFRERPSRAEDVTRIQELEAQVASKTALVLRTQEEMAYFKRELLNREDNYNKRFNASPIVGIMGSGVKPTASKSSKPRRRSA